MADPRNATAEKQARATLRAMGFDVESVAPFRESFGDEFAAVVVMNPETCPGDFKRRAQEQYDIALEALTDPRCPLVVTGERHGKNDIRIYVAFARKEA